eukprot:296232_1
MAASYGKFHHFHEAIDVDQFYHDIIRGYIRQFIYQRNVPPLVFHMCLIYFYNEQFAEYGDNINIVQTNECKLITISNLNLFKEEANIVYGRIRVTGEKARIYVWMFRIVDCSGGIGMQFGIESEINSIYYGYHTHGFKSRFHFAVKNRFTHQPYRQLVRHDMLGIRINTLTQTLSFSINTGSNPMPLCTYDDICFKDRKYRLSIDLPNKRNSAELINFAQYTTPYI